MKISIVIPVYKNKELFMQMLKSNYPFIQSHEIIVVDDYSQNDLKTSIESEYNNIIVIENEINKGFSKSVNIGIQQATGNIVFLLNSDVKLLDNGFERAVKKFVDDPALFGISFLQIEKNGTHVGRNALLFSRGLIMHRAATKMESGITAWAEGGSALFRKTMLLKLNMFDPLYSPYYWEDIDLSYRAYEQGWKVQFDSSVKVEHHHESTIKKYYSDDKVKLIGYRNQFIFFWKNIQDASLLVKHMVLLTYNLFYYGIWKGDNTFVKGFYLAVKMLPRIMKARSSQHKKGKSDWEILNQFKTV